MKADRNLPPVPVPCKGGDSTGAAPVAADCRLGPPCGSSAPNWPFSAGVASADDSYPRKNGEPDRAETSAETKERVVGKLISSNIGGFQPRTKGKWVVEAGAVLFCLANFRSAGR